MENVIKIKNISKVIRIRMLVNENGITMSPNWKFIKYIERSTLKIVDVLNVVDDMYIIMYMDMYLPSC